MYGQLHYKNSDKYCISNKNYREDYACIKSNKIDMTLSGTYLSKYPFRYIKKYKLDKYPSAEENFKLITSIKNKYKFYDEKKKKTVCRPSCTGNLHFSDFPGSCKGSRSD